MHGKNSTTQDRGATGPLKMAPGEEWDARIKLVEGALLLPRDRFIIRQMSPAVTIGGGTIDEIAPLPRKPKVDLQALNALLPDFGGLFMAHRVARRGANGITLAKLIAETGYTGQRIESQLSEPLAKGVLVRSGNFLLYSPALEDSSNVAIAVVSEFHKRNPLVPGMSKEALREKLKLSSEAFALVLDSLARGRKLEVADDLVKQPGAGVVLKDEEAQSKRQIEEAFSKAGLKVPALSEVIAGLKVDKARAQKIVTLLLREKALVKISDELVFHRAALEGLRRQVAGYKLKSAKIDVAQFKEMTGVSRKYAIPLLEYLDRERVTRRVGDAREIL